MTRRILPGTPPLEITLRRSQRARRYSIRVSRVDGRVTLSLPARAPEADALAFAQEKADWIRAALRSASPRESVGPGSVIPIEGQSVVVRPAAVRAPKLVAGDLLVPEAARAQTGRRVEAFLKLLARDRLALACDQYAKQLGRGYRGLALRDTRSRWGSCSSAGGLMFSWRLILAPPQVLDYVAAHEVAHLAEMNHSPAFWRVVGSLCPDYAHHRTWLRKNGQSLHAFDFSGQD
ncbi:M48 family metallopeptidase [Defluviimonas sp. WL0002]|uniref:M48 family metallopeptidase n=1 Tax=Albidovulum marisflavi TaxID=2984159 RepID=A0ABT2ZG55_9RHOB|nr:SprT family zinc-dependent metalloprotease [Defluviimonas sp. WL0002]MCV2870102.1 M48 family metallopeptidase [Defluviimonas sp. WL0002]